MTLITGGQLDNEEIVLLTSAARIITKDSDDQVNPGRNKGAVLTIDISAITATPILTPKLQLKDPISGLYIDIWTATVNLTAIGTTAYLFGLGGSGTAGDYTEGTNLLIPRSYRFRMVHADADSATYSVGITLLG